MKVYRFEANNKGNMINICPKIPKRLMEGEDNTTKRICVCPTIIGCILSLGWPLSLYSSFNINEGIVIYLYSAIVPAEMLFDPSIDRVPDVNITNELWIKSDTEVCFKLEDKYLLRKVKDIDKYLCEYTLVKKSDSMNYNDVCSYNFISYKVN